MASTREQLRGLVLSAYEVKSLTGWSDPMVEDYLNILENLITISGIIDSGEAETEAIENGILSYLINPEKVLPDTISVSDDYTTLGDQTVICTNSLAVTISLNSMPSEYEEVNVKRSQGSVVIDGNGKLVDGNPLVVLNTQYTSLNMVYTVDTDSWHII